MLLLKLKLVIILHKVNIFRFIIVDQILLSKEPDVHSNAHCLKRYKNYLTIFIIPKFIKNIHKCIYKLKIVFY